MVRFRIFFDGIINLLLARRKKRADKTSVNLGNDLDGIAVFDLPQIKRLNVIFNLHQGQILTIRGNRRVADIRIGQSQSTLSFLQSQIDAWNSSKD